ncbi:MAG TPA: hypothetical protein VGJ28_16790, partial [Micromonosporaceae bacterium]
LWLFDNLVTFQPQRQLDGHRIQYQLYGSNERPGGDRLPIVVVGTRQGIPVGDDGQALSAAWVADAIRELSLAGAPVRLIARPFDGDRAGAAMARWTRDLASALNVPIYHMAGAEYNGQLADFVATNYELFQPRNVPDAMPRYVADPVTRLLVPESLAANPLPGLDVHDAAEQAWQVLGASVDRLDIQPILRDGRVRGLILTPPGSGKAERLPVVPDGPIPEGQFIVAAHSSDGVVMGSLRRPDAVMAEPVPVPPARMVELLAAVEDYAAGMAVVFLVPGLGDHLPTVPAPAHYVQQVADITGTPAAATSDVDYPGDVRSQGRRTFAPLEPQFESSEAVGHLQLMSLSPERRAALDPAEPSRHPWGPLVAEVFLPVLSDGSLGLHFSGATGRTLAVPVPTLAAALARLLRGRSFIIRPVDAAGSAGSQARVRANISHVYALVSRLTGGDPILAQRSADALVIDEAEARQLVEQAERAADGSGPAAAAARRQALAVDLVRRLRQPLTDGLDDHARAQLLAAGDAVAGIYAALIPLLPPDWTVDVQIIGGLWIRPVANAAPERTRVNDLPPAPADGLIVIGAAGHEVPPQVWRAVRSALESMAPAEHQRLRAHAIDTTAAAHRLADLELPVVDEIPPPPYAPPQRVSEPITASGSRYTASRPTRPAAGKGKGKGKRREAPADQDDTRDDDLLELEELQEWQLQLEQTVATPLPADETGPQAAEQSARLNWAQDRLPLAQARIGALMDRLYPASIGAGSGLPPLAMEPAVAAAPPQTRDAADAADAVVRGWLAISDWQQSAEYFAAHHAELHSASAAHAIDQIRTEDPDNAHVDILAALVHSDFAGSGSVGYTYLTTGPAHRLTAVIDAVAAQPHLLAPVTRLVAAAAPVVGESRYNVVLLGAAQLVVAGESEQARAEIISIRPSVPPGSRVLWVERFQSLRQAWPEHEAAFRELREDIVHCGDPAT